MSNIVYIATSLDGYIAGPNNDMDWLHQVPNPDGSDFGFADFMANIDALVMGRNTFEMVLSFGVEWPYNKPVFVLSNTLKSVPEGYQDKVFLVQGALPTVVEQLHQQGYQRLYIDGGKTVQSFLAEDLIDEMIITTIPVLLGAGILLFGSLPKTLNFKHIYAQRLADHMVKNHYVRVR
ncbi:dihydrofolate reductase family protein [Vibrio vulnificus]|nr:dihydrofolate reductase [Vibrio vulnificus]